VQTPQSICELFKLLVKAGEPRDSAISPDLVNDHAADIPIKNKIIKSTYLDTLQ